VFLSTAFVFHSYHSEFSFIKIKILTWFLRMVDGWDLFRGCHKAMKRR